MVKRVLQPTDSSVYNHLFMHIFTGKISFTFFYQPDDTIRIYTAIAKIFPQEKIQPRQEKCSIFMRFCPDPAVSFFEQFLMPEKQFFIWEISFMVFQILFGHIDNLLYFRC